MTLISSEVTSGIAISIKVTPCALLKVLWSSISSNCSNIQEELQKLWHLTKINSMHCFISRI